MLKNSAIASLEAELAKILSSLRLTQVQWGNPLLVEKAHKETERLFQNASKSAGSKRDAYQVALKFLRGSTVLDDAEYDLLPLVFCEPVSEQRGIRVIGSGEKLSGLLKYYETEAKNGSLWRVTWYGLLSAYLSFNPAASSDGDKTGWGALREFLERTSKYFIETQGIVPDWVRVLGKNLPLLSKDPCAPYAEKVLANNWSQVNELAEDLGIPEGSWFWHQLVAAVVRQATRLEDSQYKAKLPMLLKLLTKHSVYRDDAIEELLKRYYRCKDRSVDQVLRDYVIDKNVWKNPKLKVAGMATSWNRVPEDVWRMVLAWVTESNLRLFFELLSGRNEAEDGRFAFWSRYLHQIGWTKLIFGGLTRTLAKSNRELAELLAQEADVSANLSSNDEHVDAFIMEIGDFIVVEFSKAPNAAYIYNKTSVPFDKNAKVLSDATSARGLKAGYYLGNCERISHPPRWESNAAHKLRNLGIYPDKEQAGFRSSAADTSSTSRQTKSDDSYLRAPVPRACASSSSAGNFTIGELQLTVSAAGGSINDLRKKGGRLWVTTRSESSAVTHRLTGWGFVRSSGQRNTWYLL